MQLLGRSQTDSAFGPLKSHVIKQVIVLGPGPFKTLQLGFSTFPKRTTSGGFSLGHHFGGSADVGESRREAPLPAQLLGGKRLLLPQKMGRPTKWVCLNPSNPHTHTNTRKDTPESSKKQKVASTKTLNMCGFLWFSLKKGPRAIKQTKPPNRLLHNPTRDAPEIPGILIDTSAWFPPLKMVQTTSWAIPRSAWCDV